MGRGCVIGSFSCREGRDEEMQRVLGAMVQAARDEPGVEVYSSHRGEDGTYWFFALISDEDSMRNHGRTPAMQVAMAQFGPLVADPPVMMTTTPLACLGPEL